MNALYVIVTVAIIGGVLAIAGIVASASNDQCKLHGGVHVTYPYRELPACWDAEGRRVFW